MRVFHGAMLPMDAASHMARVNVHVERYAKRGWNTSPVEFRGKAPARGWDGPRNVAVVLGAKSGHLVDVDLDSPEAIALAARHQGGLSEDAAAQREEWLAG